MRILLVNDYAVPFGGAEVMTFALRDGLRRLGHDVRLVASSAGQPDGAPVSDYTCQGSLSWPRTWLQCANPSAYVQLRRALVEFRPDVVHVRMFLTQISPLILPLLAQVPALYHVVWYRPICPTGRKLLPSGSACETSPGIACARNGCVPWRHGPPLLAQLRVWQRWHHVFDRIVANSQAVQRALLAEGISPVEVIHNGVAIEPLNRTLSPVPSVTYAGRLVREKGVDVLLRAFADVTRSLPSAHLQIAGDGPERSALQALATQLGITAQVSFRGQLERGDMARRFAGSWVQVVPSRWAEPFGLVAAEAMARGTAVVASRTGGLTEIVEPGVTGLSVEPDDPHALAAGLLAILSDRDQAEAMGRRGWAVAAERFNIAQQCDKFVALYQRIMGTA